MGHSPNPNSIYSLEGIWNTQTTHNGGGQHPPCDWVPGEPLLKTRLTVPVETVRVGSLPKSYLNLVESFDSSDHFLHECVNMGVPLRTANSIYRNIQECLKRANIPERENPDSAYCPPVSRNSETWDQISEEWPEYERFTRAPRRSSDAHCAQKSLPPTDWKHYAFIGGHNQGDDLSYSDGTVRQIRVDTGCDTTLGFTDHDGRLFANAKSRIWSFKQLAKTP